MFITRAVCNMFSYMLVLTMALHILNVECARNQKCLSSGFISIDTDECYCYVNGTPQICRKQSSKGGRFNSMSHEQSSKLRSRSNGVSARIVGGDRVNISRHPYMLALEEWGRLKCGATMIGHRWALTAAHCVLSSKYLPALQLRAHTSQLVKGGRTFKVITAIPHEDFTMKKASPDIALMKVDRPFDVGQRFVPAQLPEQGKELAQGTMVTVVGWGNTHEYGFPSPYLQEVHLPIVSYESCRRIHGDQITTDMICAGYPEGGKDACQADSGGPMILDKTVVGIVSAGIGCARKNNPGVYTKVSAMRDWIRKKTYI